MTTCKTLLLVSLLAKLQELPVCQLAMHVDPFYLVITDKRRPAAWLFSGRNTLPLLWCSSSYKAHYSFQLSCCTLNPRVSPAVCASNKSFFSTCDMVFVRQVLTSFICINRTAWFFFAKYLAGIIETAIIHYLIYLLFNKFVLLCSLAILLKLFYNKDKIFGVFPLFETQNTYIIQRHICYCF
jgi:hypothetical protein